MMLIIDTLRFFTEASKITLEEVGVVITVPLRLCVRSLKVPARRVASIVVQINKTSGSALRSLPCPSIPRTAISLRTPLDANCKVRFYPSEFPAVSSLSSLLLYRRTANPGSRTTTHTQATTQRAFFLSVCVTVCFFLSFLL